MLIAPLLAGQDSIFKYLQKMNGIYFIPIFAVVVVGMLNRRVPAIAGSVGLLLGVIVIALGYFLPGKMSPMALMGMHEFHFLGVVFALLVTVMLAIGAAKPRATPWELTNSNTIDMTPWKNAKWASLGLIAIVLAIYIGFAR
jgi:SSS family solute:Na+ symporter